MADFIGGVAKRSPRFDSFAFPEEACHYDLFNYLFVNFNYTPLLDDYVFRDAQQFQPQAHRYADRNFSVRQHVDGASKSRGAGKANVAGDQLGAQYLGEHDVAGVVGRDVLAQFPHSP